MAGVQVPQLFVATASQSLRPAINNSDEDTERSEVRLIKTIMPFYTYILECADGSFYVGYTNNLEKRLKQHNQSKWGAHYTKIRRPITLKHSEKFKTLTEARRRESEIKSWRREKKLNLIKFRKSAK